MLMSKERRNLLKNRILLLALIITIVHMLYTYKRRTNITSGSNKRRRPHILFIVADDLGYNDVGYHGSEIKTPNLDKLAMSGVRLENYYVQPICSPTRSQLLSGRYQIHTGLQHSIIFHTDPRSIPLDSKTLADKLSDAGYSTHMVGKWHIGYHKSDYLPTRRGFHHFFGFLNGHNDYYNYMSRYHKYSGYDLRENEARANVQKYRGKYSTKVFADRVIDIFTQHKTDQPLFVYLPFQAPHTPLQVPQEYMNYYYGLNQEEKRRIYSAMVTCMDEAIGNVTRALKQSGIWDDTLLIFSTDNGGQPELGSNRPLRGYKGSYWEGGIRAVGFVHGHILNKNTQGTVSRELLHVTDWFPTLINLVGGDFDGTKPLDGFDQWDTISEGKPSKREEMLINIDPLLVASGEPQFNNTFDTRISAALRMGKWKLLTGQPAGGPVNRFHKHLFLFDLENDPNEYRDLSLKHPEVVNTMLQRLEYYQSTAVPAIEPKHDPMANPFLNGGYWGPWLD